MSGRTRQMCEVQCPICNLKRKMRTDSFKSVNTTNCQSCNWNLRPRKPENERFNYLKYYRSLEGKASNLYTAQVQKCKERNHPLPIYTREELIEYLINSLIYIKLFNIWKFNNFEKNYAPSVNRLNDYKSYSFDNIEIVSWKYNNDIFTKDTISGKTAKVCKAVDQLDLKNNFIKRFHSQQAAMRELGIDSAKISAVCIGKPVKKSNNRTTMPISAGGFKWRFSTIPNTK